MLVIGRVKNSNLSELAKCKFLFPATATVGDLCHYINSKLHRTEEAPMYIYANSELVVSKGSVIAEVYQEYREDDFFLYLGYYEENVYADIGRES
ncbi:Gamma-aminobutyric acid receptor-associated protein [Geodia barretti]|uniref:Gamma-aminobutyric acid receptor-associated protein n=1 Tax=Geodia barretti TaxID=519541 RepID=A0AA35W847_GEOBA|nr:Gamma-aminobutyric acid receptor-associated protein [Geodia barretti]